MPWNEIDFFEHDFPNLGNEITFQNFCDQQYKTKPKISKMDLKAVHEIEITGSILKCLKEHKKYSLLVDAVSSFVDPVKGFPRPPKDYQGLQRTPPKSLGLEKTPQDSPRLKTPVESPRLPLNPQDSPRLPKTSQDSQRFPEDTKRNQKTCLDSKGLSKTFSL